MIKLIVNLTRLVVLWLLALTAVSCQFNLSGFDTIEGEGNVQQEVRKLDSGFTNLKVQQGLEVEITQGIMSTLVVEADENLLPIIKTEVENGTLKIYSDKNIRKAKSKKIRIELTDLEGIEISSGASVVIAQAFASTNLSIETSSGSTFKGLLEIENLRAESSSGSTIEMRGMAIKGRLESSSGSTIKAESLKIHNAEAEASSGSTIHIWPHATLDAQASSGASVLYHHNPAQIKTNTSSGGSVNKAE
jgi:hypothetical protein